MRTLPFLILIGVMVLGVYPSEVYAQSTRWGARVQFVAAASEDPVLAEFIRFVSEEAVARYPNAPASQYPGDPPATLASVADDLYAMGYELSRADVVEIEMRYYLDQYRYTSTVLSVTLSSYDAAMDYSQPLLHLAVDDPIVFRMFSEHGLLMRGTDATVGLRKSVDVVIPYSYLFRFQDIERATVLELNSVVARDEETQQYWNTWLRRTLRNIAQAP